MKKKFLKIIQLKKKDKIILKREIKVQEIRKKSKISQNNNNNNNNNNLI